MKKGMLVVSLIFLIFSTYFIIAAETTVSEKGYACLELKVAEKCSSLSVEERIFSLLAIDRCKSEVVEDSQNNKCWPNSECKIKTTAQAILALSSVGASTLEAEDWLLSQTVSPPDVDWLLQIESTNPTSCEISYLGEPPYTISINENKEISASAGSCLRLYDNYWLRVSSSCYDEEFEITCDETFFTSLLYKKKDSNIVYVSKDISSASAGGRTTERINSFCFKQGTSCSYEGSLWAALVLKLRGYDSSPYLPYLITMAEEYPEFIPESFLYSLTGSFKEEFLLKQKEGKWWSESGDKFYDTAAALYSLQQEEPTEKTGAKAWLEEVQGENGCWQDNVRNTAFILFSIWPKKIISTTDSKLDCEDSGYYCMTGTACQQSEGDNLMDYGGCFGANICCSVESLLESCSLQKGEICSSGEICDGDIVDAADTTKCCIKGDCVQVEEEKSECEKVGGACKSSCSNDEESSNYDCPSFDLCCVEKSKSLGYVWIIIFIILISLVVLGIIFRKRLRKFLLKVKSKFRKGKSSPGAPKGPRRFPPGPSASIPQRITPRRILPPNQRQARKYVPVRRPQSEVENVLKKLKEMGK